MPYQKKNVVNSVDYNSFLTRDYKSVLEPKPAKPLRGWTRLHTLLVVVTIITAATILTFVSGDAEATRSEQLSAIEADPMETDAAKKITIPLHFPALKQFQPEEQITTYQELTPNKQQTKDSEPQVVDQQLSSHWISHKVKRGENLAVIFQKQKLNPVTLHQLMKLGRITQTLKRLRPGQVFRFQIDDTNKLLAMEYEITQLESLLVTRDIDNGFEARAIQRTLDSRLAFANGEINSSLFEAGKQTGMTDSLIMELVSIFGWDIDFAMDIRQGDHFTLLYKEQFLEGEKVKDGPIVAAEFTSQGRTYRAVRYTDSRGNSDYYTPDGHSMRKAFLRTPVDFRRISSRFGKRRHPVLKTRKMHMGVDYAAKRGTPIKAAGDGKITFRGRKGGYGRVVIIQHGGRYSTLYAHMNSFKRGLRVGSRTKQGQIIGYVGSSGRATGPHLHYEFRVNGTHRNPLTVRLPDAAPIRKSYQKDFELKTKSVLSQLDMHISTTQVALNQP